MKIVRAKTAGFCMGVDLALKKLDAALKENNNKRICTFGPIIHNPQVLEDYAKQGVTCINNLNDVQAGDCVIIRAHGIPRQVEHFLIDCGAMIIDATCPKVKKAQLAIAKATKNGTTLLLYGESEHPEVRGLMSYAHAESFVFDSFKDLQRITLAPQSKYVLASQTTQDKQQFIQIQNFLHEQLGELPILSTICDATSHRQEDIMQIAAQVDGIVVVGGKDSGNTRRLADITTAMGVPTWHVETSAELDKKNFDKMYTVGLTAGASTPKRLIDAVHMFLEAI